MPADARQLVDPAFFSRLENLELRAKGIVEGFMHGLHRSPFVGFSVEFASHREYAQGDDLRHVNWKLFARQRRLYVKQFDAETNMNLYLLLDISGSMDCRSKGISKREYGAALAAALAHLALKQHDAVGLALLADEVVAHLPPKARTHQLQEILRVIDGAKPRPTADHAQGSSGRAFQQAAELCNHRGIVVILSDLFDDLDTLMKAIERLRFRNHEVIVFHLWDPWERYLPLEGHYRFHDLETDEVLVTQAESVRDDYLRAVEEWRAQLETECRNRAIDRVELTTDEPLDQALLDYLVRRAKAG
ncbi:MAG TPA: DUF58 domain-containing protein [Pirellulales bacterium]|nr:DUF58 domain-containing protein [Pirellulales bacterium]